MVGFILVIVNGMRREELASACSLTEVAIGVLRVDQRKTEPTKRHPTQHTPHKIAAAQSLKIKKKGC